MEKRDPAIVAILGFITCHLYLIYWQYVTTAELREVSGRDDLNPVIDLILVIFTCGFWSWWVGYRNARIVNDCFRSRNLPHEDRSTLVLILYCVSLFAGGLTTLVAKLLLQEEYNRLADALEGRLSAGAHITSAFR